MGSAVQHDFRLGREILTVESEPTVNTRRPFNLSNILPTCIAQNSTVYPLSDLCSSAIEALNPCPSG